jgi:hypothetical protein
VISTAVSLAGNLGGLAVLGLATLALTAIQVRIDPSPYRKYFGDATAIGVIAAATILGFVSLWYLASRDWFESGAASTTGEWTALVAASALLFGAVAVAADVALRFPRDTNVGSPDAFFFYPSMAFAVEVGLHVVPLALAAAVFGRVGPDDGDRFWVLLLAVASFEAILQARASARRALAVFSGVHVLAFGLVQLYTFQRFGFVPMYTLRFAYYAVWHIVWGTARLRLIF